MLPRLALPLFELSATAAPTATPTSSLMPPECPRFTPLIDELLVVITTLLLCLWALGAFYLKNYWLPHLRARRAARKDGHGFHSDKLHADGQAPGVYQQHVAQQENGRMWPSGRDSLCSDEPPGCRASVSLW